MTFLPVDKNGMPDLVLFEQRIRADTILVAAMYANNETGVVFPINEMAAIAKKHGVLFFSDATQAVGKIPVDVLKDDINLLACLHTSSMVQREWALCMCAEKIQE